MEDRFIIMVTPRDPLSLAHWRRTTAEMYTRVRRAAEDERLAAWYDFRTARDKLFKTHAQSPLDAEQREAFTQLVYYQHDPAWRVVGRIDVNVEQETLCVQLEDNGEFIYTRIGRIHFTLRGEPAQLSLFWVEGYGGGLFLPFKDGSNGYGTYRGGRYLYDTIKGVDLGVGTSSEMRMGTDALTGARTNEIVLDFNYAYNPSCGYNGRWKCPLPPAENQLSMTIEAGEKAFDWVEEKQ